MKVPLLLLFFIFLVTILTVFLFLNTVYSQPFTQFKWWNTSWHYRVKLEINSTAYQRTDWPIEHNINFTQALEQMGISGTFDENSTRVMEYNSSGSILYEVPSQFDKEKVFDASDNAIGTVVFTMNGSTPANEKRHYFIYFDILENGAKDYKNYSSTSNLTFDWNGEEFQVNNTEFSYFVDTIRGENVSGIYRVYRRSDGWDVFTVPGANERTIEYIQYSNGTYNFSFDFRNNATFTLGPARLTVEQVGEETFWNDTENKTFQGLIVKRYYFYEKVPWIKIEQNFTNLAGYPITRNSTLGGALTFDAKRGIGSGYSEAGNDTEPFSWRWAYIPLSIGFGVMNIEETGTQNFSAKNDSSAGKIGICLNSTLIPGSSSITETALAKFEVELPDYNNFIAIKNRFVNSYNIILKKL